ncbi:MAG: RhuM family protein [Akkermansiaceae bacterium]
MSNSSLPAETSSFFLYSGKEGRVPIECRAVGETIWLTQKQLSELFDVGVPAINKHLKNIFETGELVEAATVSKMEIVRLEGTREVKRQVVYYNLDAIIAAELIYSNADAEKINMGLTTWKNAPAGKILKSDVKVAKNYLSQAHIDELNQIVSAYLDLAANRAQRGIVMTMKDWAGFLNNFLELSNYPILADKGKISSHKAQLKAEEEYKVFRKTQDLEYRSDFDEEVKRIEGKSKNL